MSSVPLASTASVIVVEDEPVTRALLGGCLREAGLTVTCLDGAQALLGYEPLAEIDLVLLDIELPDGDGYALAQWLRARSEAGIIYVSRRADASERVRGLELGGDDFIVKPPDLDELVARVRAVLRRRSPTRAPTRSSPEDAAPVRPAGARARFAEWTFDPQRFELASGSGSGIALTQGEARVLDLLTAAQGRTVPRAALQEAIRGLGPSSSPRSLDVLVHRLRRKLGEGGNVVPRLLLTVHGIGYRLGVGVTLEPG